MCRLLALVSPTPRSVRDALPSDQVDRLLALSKVHADGWGTVWLDRDQNLQRLVSPMPAYRDEAFEQALSEPSRARIVHLRFATASLAVAPENTHPFRHGDLTLAHNGSILPVERLRALVPPKQAAWLQGTTDSELYLALVQDQLDAGVSDLAAAVSGAIDIIRPGFPSASLNAMLMTPDHVVVVRSSTHTVAPVAELRKSTFTHLLPIEHHEHYFRLWSRPLDDTGVIVASTGLDTTGWTRVPRDSITSWDLRTMHSERISAGLVGDPSLS